MALENLTEKSLSKLLQEGAAYLKKNGIPSPRLESELLFSQLLNIRRIDLYLSPRRPISTLEEDSLWDRLQRRAAHEPLQYILGEVEFCGMTFNVENGVFIPRPETELIVEVAAELSPPPKRILDLCTGSGALALALARLFPSSKVIASDISAPALQVARSNRDRHQLASQVAFLQGDLFAPLQAFGQFDLIVCNPPYISEKESSDLQPEVRDYEPPLALYATENGTSFYRRILREAASYLKPLGHLIFELGAGQSEWLQEFTAKETPFSTTFIQDLAGINRIASLQRRGGARRALNG